MRVSTTKLKFLDRRFPMDEVDRNRLEEFRQLRQEVRHSEEYLIVGIDIAKERTANYHKPLGEYLITLGRTVVLVSGVTVKRNRESLDGRWDKHDTKDAANVADLISQGKCLYYKYPSAELRGLR